MVRYDKLTQRMIIRCVPGSMQESLPIFFLHTISSVTTHAEPEWLRRLQVATNDCYVLVATSSPEASAPNLSTPIPIFGSPQHCVVGEFPIQISPARLWPSSLRAFADIKSRPLSIPKLCYVAPDESEFNITPSAR